MHNWQKNFHGIFSKILIYKLIKSELKIAQGIVFDFSKERLEMDSSEFEEYFYMLNFTYKLSDKIIKLIHETEI